MTWRDIYRASLRQDTIEHVFELDLTHHLPQLSTRSGYPGVVPVKTEAVAAALRERLPGLPLKKLHKLLYYSQGHHLAMTGRPLFDDSLSAWDMGPVVGGLWWREKEGLPRAIGGDRLSESQLNTIGYVVSRYGGMSGADLERLSHHEDPWLHANLSRGPRGTAPISAEALLTWFSESQDADDLTSQLDRAEVRQWLDAAVPPDPALVPIDDRDALRDRLHAG